ncbi:hypothetical protein SALBM311S_00081 [Streptomyces alboniger]
MGVRLTWRRFADIGQRVEIPPPAMYELVDAGYEYLDGLVDQSVRGYAEAAARQAGERLRLQRRLMELLLAEHHRGDPADALTERAARIGWPLPEKVAVGVLLRPAREAVAPAVGQGVGQGVLLDMDYEQPRMVVPEQDAAGRPELLHRALTGWAGAIGPPVPLADAAKSLRWAEAAVRLMERRLLPEGEVLYCTEHTEALVLLQPEELLGDLALRCLAPLTHCGPTHGRRLAETLLAWLETPGAGRPRWLSWRVPIRRRSATGSGRSASCGAPRSTTRTGASNSNWCCGPSGCGGFWGRRRGWAGRETTGAPEPHMEVGLGAGGVGQARERAPVKPAVGTHALPATALSAAATGTAAQPPPAPSATQATVVAPRLRRTRRGKRESRFINHSTARRLGKLPERSS